MSLSSFKISIAGLGTVGAGVIDVLQQNADLILARAGRPIEIISVSASNKSKDRGVDISYYEWADSLESMALDPRIDMVVECIGGANGHAKDLVEKALENGKHVVTANKALMAEHGLALSKIAEVNNVSLMYEAAVAGGVPVIKALREGLSANKITSIHAILNGTCNYILSEMRKTGRDFDVVLKEAQDKGYAEADPTFDVDGIDTAHKLVLLNALAFGVEPNFNALSVEGIRRITAKDISYAGELGYRIKLLGVAHQLDDKIIQAVEPCLVPIESAIGSVEDVFNAVLTQGDFVGKTMMEGRGAGAGPTASSVIADIIDVARGNTPPVFGVPVSQLKKANWQNSEVLHTAAYVHFKVADDSGVLADVTNCLKEYKVSVDSFIQREHEEDGAAHIVIVTHEALFSEIKKAIAAVGALACVLEEPTLLRIEDIT